MTKNEATKAMSMFFSHVDEQGRKIYAFFHRVDCGSRRPEVELVNEHNLDPAGNREPRPDHNLVQLTRKMDEIAN